ATRSGGGVVVVVLVMAVTPFGSAPAAAARAVTTTVADAPAASVPRSQLTGTAAEHVPWLGTAETSVSDGLGVSVTTTFSAGPGPRFRAVTVYVSVSPTFTVWLLAVFVTTTSAGSGGGATNVTGAVSKLFARSLSCSRASAAAALTTVRPARDASERATTTICTAPPAGIGPRAQDTAVAHVPCVGVAETGWSSAGTKSRSATPVASLGPSLRTTTRNVASPPASTCGAAVDFSTTMSTSGMIRTAARSALFAGLLSVSRP